MLDLVLLTFIVAFVFYHLERKIKIHCDKVMPFNMPEKAIISACYILFIILLVMFVSEGMPVVVNWCKSLAGAFTSLNITEFYAELDPHLRQFLEYIDLGSTVRSIGTWMSGQIAGYSTSTLSFMINLFIALILAFIILCERKRIEAFGKSMSESRGVYVYEYLANFGKNFCETFGKVMKVQITIALVNGIASTIALAIMGFPGVPALGIMIFCLGLIPVAGVIVSLIPLSILALSIGGWMKLLEVIIMICVLHAIEAYLLNPKLMSSKTNLPVSFTLIILLVGEHYLGVWGLLIGVPLFLFLMKLLEVEYEGK
jgi:predicted PurR-regulated permease PerM